MAVPTIPEIRELMEAGMHFGHASGKWHPKMKPYIFATRDKLHIIDLEKTREKLAEVLGILEQRLGEGKTVVLVGTKKQVGDRIKELGERTGLPYINVRWLGGTMTNFTEVGKSISRMKKQEEFLASPEAESMIKKERVMLENDLNRTQHKFEGLRNLNKKPDALFIIDPGYEHNAVKEGRHEGIELFAVVDTNCDPSSVDHVIPANDDAPKSLNLLLNLLEQTILSGQKLREVNQAAAAKEVEKAANEPEKSEVPVEAPVEEKIESDQEKKPIEKKKPTTKKAAPKKSVKK